MSPAQLLVNNVPVPHGPLSAWLGVDNDLVTVPRFDGRNELLAALDSTQLDFAGAGPALGVVLIARADLDRFPLAGRVLRYAADALVTGHQDVSTLAAGRFDRVEIVNHPQRLVEHFRVPATAR